MADLNQDQKNEINRFLGLFLPDGEKPTDADRKAFGELGNGWWIFGDHNFDALKKYNDKRAELKNGKIQPGTDQYNQAIKDVQDDIIKHHPKLYEAIQKVEKNHPAAPAPAPAATQPQGQAPQTHKAGDHPSHHGSAHMAEFQAHQPPEKVRIDYAAMKPEEQKALHDSEKDLATGYDVNGFTLTDAQKKQIDGQQDDMTKIVAGGHKVRLNGDCSTTASDDYNTALGYARAETVRQYLLSKKDDKGNPVFTEDQIEVTSGGKKDLEKPTGDNVEEAANRRVTVSEGSEYKAPDAKPAEAPAPVAAKDTAPKDAATPASPPADQPPPPPPPRSGLHVFVEVPVYHGSPFGLYPVNRYQAGWGSGWGRGSYRDMDCGPVEGRSFDNRWSKSAVPQHDEPLTSRYRPSRVTKDSIVPQFAEHDASYQKIYGDHRQEVFPVDGRNSKPKNNPWGHKR